MPIYAYRCDSCGFEKDHLQKLGDPVLRICPQCAQATYSKQVTAAGFQLKGNGWYVTDFKDGGKGAVNAGKAVNTKVEGAAKESASPTEVGKPTASAETAAPSTAAPTGAAACADS
ncbi:MAG TPA: zinc ribbon domain-containing protein [Accumulibacter sp.]|jgi:putative FmdB family regulatory protein|nr:zinc ribbon domain-containing protein [Accumulibacter sp.]